MSRNETLDRILLIEDDRAIREIVETALTEIGNFEVFAAESGREGLATLPDFRPDLIVLDVMMPNLDGRRVFEKIKQRSDLQRAPVVFLTAKGQDSDIESLEEMGAAGVINKPFDARDLSEKLESIWRAA